MKIRSLLIFIFLPTFMFAQWTQISGPEGGDASQIVTIGSDIFIGMRYGGVFRSSDNGNTWIAVNNGLTTRDVRCLTVNGTNLFAGTSYGLFKSVDNGNTWTNVYPVAIVSAIATKGNTVFQNAVGLQKTINNGTTWIPCSTGLPGGPSSIFVSGNNIFVGINGSGVYISSDDGVSWNSVNNSGVNNFPMAFTQNGTSIFMGSAEGVYRTDNNGLSWILTNTGITDSTICSLEQINGVVFAGTSNGLFKTVNNGISWTPVVFDSVHSIIRDLVFSGGSFYAGSNCGFYISADSGSTWTKKNNGIFATQVYSLYNWGGGIYAGTNSGIFFTQDQGNSWTELNTGTTNADVRTFEAMGTKLFMATYTAGAFMSNDSGHTWTQTKTGMASPQWNVITDFAVDSFRLYASTFHAVYLSLDSGNTWSQPGGPTSQPFFECMSMVGNILYGGAARIYSSTDHSVSFTNVTGSPQNGTFYEILPMGNDFYTASLYGVDFYNGNALTWAAKNNGITGPVISIVPAGNILYACTRNSGVYISYDNADTWTPINVGLDFLNVQALLVDGNDLYAGTVGGGVYKNSTSTFIHSDKNIKKPFMIVPNPISNENATLLSDNHLENATVTICDLLGKIIYTEKNIFGNSFTLNLKNIVAGIYMVQINNEGKVEMEKIIIQ